MELGHFGNGTPCPLAGDSRGRAQTALEAWVSGGRVASLAWIFCRKGLEEELPLALRHGQRGEARTHPRSPLRFNSERSGLWYPCLSGECLGIRSGCPIHPQSQVCSYPVVGGARPLVPGVRSEGGAFRERSEEKLGTMVLCSDLLSREDTAIFQLLGILADGSQPPPSLGLALCRKGLHRGDSPSLGQPMG